MECAWDSHDNLRLQQLAERCLESRFDEAMRVKALKAVPCYQSLFSAVTQGSLSGGSQTRAPFSCT